MWHCMTPDGDTEHMHCAVSRHWRASSTVASWSGHNRIHRELRIWGTHTSHSIMKAWNCIARTRTYYRKKSSKEARNVFSSRASALTWTSCQTPLLSAREQTAKHTISPANWQDKMLELYFNRSIKKEDEARNLFWVRMRLLKKTPHKRFLLVTSYTPSVPAPDFEFVEDAKALVAFGMTRRTQRMVPFNLSVWSLEPSCIDSDRWPKVG